MTEYSVSELICRKRDGGALAGEELRALIAGYTAGTIPDYQMSALLMAILFRGMDDDELRALTDAMLHSGAILDLSAVDAPKVDKHSTGGVGDKISIPLVPLVAAAGAAVPMISGRGLGHTGGTLDKLESIPGFSTQIDPAAFARQLDEIGVVMAGQTVSLVPADLHLYALRDATGTVPSVPLIASSIMSKKLAEDIDGLLLDVKVGSGATLAKDIVAARELAEMMAAIGAAHQTPVVAMLTDMSQPLGVEVGNANEIEESLAVLRGEGPADVTELVVAFGAEMLVLAGIVDDVAPGRAAIEDGIASGSGLERMAALIAAQGGDPQVIEDTGLLPRADATHELTASRSGFVAACDALAVGIASVRLGAGRTSKEDTIDPGVGISILAKRGDRVDAGQPLARVRYRDPARLQAALRLLEGAWQIGDEPPTGQPLIIEVVR